MELHLHQQQIERAQVSVCRFRSKQKQQFFLRLAQVIVHRGLTMGLLQLQRLTWPILGYVWRCRTRPKRQLPLQWDQILQGTPQELPMHLNLRRLLPIELSVWLRLSIQRLLLSYKISEITIKITFCSLRDMTS